MTHPRTPGYAEAALASSARHGDDLNALGGKLAGLVASLARQETPDDVRERLAQIEAEHRRLRAAFVEVQERHAELAALCAAGERLHEVSGREEGLAVLEEIAVNLVGAEDLAVFARAGDGRLAPIHGLGIDERGLPPITIGDGPLGRAAAENRIVVAEGGTGAAAGPLAFVPFRTNGRPGGAVAFYRLLPQKAGVTAFDLQIFYVLQRHAGLVLGPDAGR